MLNLLTFTIIAYLLGSIPFGLIVGWVLLRRDIRAGGSGHSGATNTLRQAGWGAGIVVLVLDLGKGALAEWLALRYGTIMPLTPILAGVAAVAGHCWPVFAGFRGGMGMATAGGVLLAAWPLGFVIGIGLAALGSLALRHSARGNFMAGLLIGPVLWLFSRSADLALIATTVGVLVSLRSLSDWNRLYRGLWLDRD